MFCKYCGNKMDGLSCSVCGRKAVLAKRSTELEKKMAEKVPAAPKAAAGDAEYQRGFLDGKKSGLQEGYRNGLSDAAKTQGTEKKQFAPLQGRMLVSAAALAAIVGLIAGGLSFWLGYKSGQKSVREEVEEAGTQNREEVLEMPAVDEVLEEKLPTKPDEDVTEEAGLAEEPERGEKPARSADPEETEEQEKEEQADTVLSEKTDTDGAGDGTGISGNSLDDDGSGLDDNGQEMDNGAAGGEEAAEPSEPPAQEVSQANENGAMSNPAKDAASLDEEGTEDQESEEDFSSEITYGEPVSELRLVDEHANTEQQDVQESLESNTGAGTEAGEIDAVTGNPKTDDASAHTGFQNSGSGYTQYGSEGSGRKAAESSYGSQSGQTDSGMNRDTYISIPPCGPVDGGHGRKHP